MSLPASPQVRMQKQSAHALSTKGVVTSGSRRRGRDKCLFGVATCKTQVRPVRQPDRGCMRSCLLRACSQTGQESQCSNPSEQQSAVVIAVGDQKLKIGT